MTESSVVNEEGKTKPKKKHVKVTPLPKLQMIAVGATLLAEAICTTMLLPFVGLYVAYLRGVSAESAGYASGMLVGLFMLGQVVSGKFWGWVSDCYGRKFPLCIGLLSAAFVMLIFGMSPNFLFCCLMRFLHGIFNGNILIAKIIIADITDETNQPVGFAMIGLLWSIGSVIGPAVGGFLYDPLINSKLQFLHVHEGNFLAKNPAFLPSLFVFLYTVLSFAIVVVVIPETNKNRTRSLRNVIIVGWFLNRFRPKKVIVVDAPVDNTNNENNESGGERTTEGRLAAPPLRPRTVSYREAFSDSIIRNILYLAMCASSSDMAYSQSMPLWAIAAKEVGGLGLFSDAVGLLILSFAVPTFIVNLSFPTLYRKVGNPYCMWRIGAVIVSASLILTPFGSQFGDRSSFWYVLLMGSIRQGVFSGCFTVLNILIVNAAFPGTVGSVYGIMQSVISAVRCVIPFIISPAFAWSISGKHTFPFNHCFVFFLSALPMLFTIFMSYVKVLVRPKTDDQNEMEAAEENTGEDEEQHDKELADEREAILRCASIDDYSSIVGSIAASSNENRGASRPRAHRRTKRSSSRREKSPYAVLEWIHGTTPFCGGEGMTSTMEMFIEEDSRLLEEELIIGEIEKEIPAVI